jgi:hypothetical protein
MKNYFTSLILLAGLSASIISCSHDDMGPKEDEDPDLIEADSFLLAYHSFDGQLGNWFENSTCCDWAANINSSVKRAGSHSARFELRNHDALYDFQAQLGRAPNKNKEGWFGFSLYFPNTFVSDSLEDGIVQWQSLPDLAKGEEWRSPPVLLGVLSDSLVLEIRTDAKEVTRQGESTFTRINLGKLDKDVWLDWVFHIRWAYDETGILEVWKNGDQVVNRANKANSYNDLKFPYLKVGIGKWGWASAPSVSPFIKERVIYVDEVTVGKENAGYDKVRPGRK